jgi:glycine oxidase
MHSVASSDGIVVIGAGIVGCAVACELAGRGASVTVLDDRRPGMGATQASAGMLAPFVEARREGPLLDLAARSLGLFDGFVSRAHTESGCPIQYRRTGTLDVALAPESLEELRRARQRLASLGVASELCEGAAVRDVEPLLTERAIGGLLIPTHGFVSAVDLTHALAACAGRYGAKFAAGGRVTRVSRDRTGLILERGAGDAPLRADVAVLAAGSWAGTIAVEGLERPIPVRPVRGQLLHARWNGGPPARVIWSERCYVVPWQDGTVLVGATEEDAGFDERTTLAGIRDLIGAASDLLPGAWTASLVAARAGLRPGSPDHVPLIGWSTVLPGLMYATGHYRNGILLAPLTADLVARAVLGDGSDPMLALTRPQRFGDL